jgi:hypothetical protein
MLLVRLLWKYNKTILNIVGTKMPREEMLNELTDDFPSKHIYNFDEQFRYDTDRIALMDKVLEGTFETYVRVEAEMKFSYEIIGCKKFDLEVRHDGFTWKKTFDYVTDAFEIGEAAYRLLIVYPRVMQDGEVLHEREVGAAMDVKCYELHDHCLVEEDDEIEILNPPRRVLKGKYIEAKIFACSDGNFLLSVVHISNVDNQESLLDQFFTYFELAELIAHGYLQCVDFIEFPRQLDETYKCVYLRSIH